MPTRAAKTQPVRASGDRGWREVSTQMHRMTAHSAVLLEELGDRIDRQRVHLFGEYPDNCRSSTAQQLVYLSKAFVLSWSLWKWQRHRC